MRNVTLNAERAEVPIYRVQLVEDAHFQARQTINHAEDAAEILADYIGHQDREHFVILMLDAKNDVIGIHTVGIGTLTCTAVAGREVFKAAILANAASIILGHNHPSGDPTPSIEDRNVTQDLKQAGGLLDIPVLDHVIVGHRGKYCSLASSGEFDARCGAGA